MTVITGDTVTTENLDNAAGDGPKSVSDIVGVATSGELTIAGGASITTWAHGLGAQPKSVQLFGVCQSADGNYSAGDVLLVTEFQLYGAVEVDATNVVYRTNVGSGSAYGRMVNHDSAYAAFTPTEANWKLIIQVAL